MCPCSWDNLKPVSTFLFRASDASGTNHVKTHLRREGWTMVFVSPSTLRSLIPCSSAVPAGLRARTALDVWSAGCALGVQKVPKTFSSVQVDATPVRIAYERLQAGPDAAPGNSSIPCIAEAEGCFLKAQ